MKKTPVSTGYLNANRQATLKKIYDTRRGWYYVPIDAIKTYDTRYEWRYVDSQTGKFL